MSTAIVERISPSVGYRLLYYNGDQEQAEYESTDGGCSQVGYPFCLFLGPRNVITPFPA